MARQYPQLGPLKGPGTTTSDSIPAMYSKGEVVISAADVKAIGKAFGKNYLSNLVKTASKDTPPKLGAQTMVKDGKLKASGGFGLDGEDVSGGIDWNQGKTDWDQGMPDWNEGQTKFMGGTLFAAGGYDPYSDEQRSIRLANQKKQMAGESKLKQSPDVLSNTIENVKNKGILGSMYEGAKDTANLAVDQTKNFANAYLQSGKEVSGDIGKVLLGKDYSPDKTQDYVSRNVIEPLLGGQQSSTANTAVSPAINTTKTTAPIGSMAKPSQGQYSLSIIDQMFPDQADKVAPSSAGSEDAAQSKTQSGFIQTDNGIPYNVAKQADGTNTINFTNPDGTGTGTLSGLSGEQAGRFRDGKGAMYSGPGLPDVKPAQIGAQQMQQPYLGENNSGVDESNAYLDQMRDIAVNGGPDRFMSLSEMIAAKHRMRGAQDVLNNISQDNQNKRQNSLENAKLGVDTLLAKQRMDQAKTQQEYEAAQQDFMNSLEVGKIGYQMKRDEKGDQAASAKAAQENKLAQDRLIIDQSKLALDTKNADKTHYGVKIDENGNPISYPTDGPGAEAQINFQRNFAKRVSDPDYAVAVKKFGVEKADQLYEDHLRSQVK